MGPVITPQSKARIEGLIGQAVQEGATLLVDGRNPAMPGFEPLSSSPRRKWSSNGGRRNGRESFEFRIHHTELPSQSRGESVRFRESP